MLVISVLCLVLSVGAWRWLYNKSKHVARIVRKYNKYWCVRRSSIDFIMDLSRLQSVQTDSPNLLTAYSMRHFCIILQSLVRFDAFLRRDAWIFTLHKLVLTILVRVLHTNLLAFFIVNNELRSAAYWTQFLKLYIQRMKNATKTRQYLRFLPVQRQTLFYIFFYVHVTVQRNKFLYIKTN